MKKFGTAIRLDKKEYKKKDKNEPKLNKQESPNRKGTKKPNRKGTKKSKKNIEKSHSKDHDVKSRSKPPVFVKNWVIKSSFVLYKCLRNIYMVPKAVEAVEAA